MGPSMGLCTKRRFMKPNYYRLVLAIVYASALTVLVDFLVRGPFIHHSTEFVPGERYNSDE